MTYHQQVADRLRQALAGKAGITEKKLPGGLAFLLHGNMVCVVINSDLVVRLGNEQGEWALSQEHVRPIDFAGKPMKSMVYVAAAGFADSTRLTQWLDKAISFAGTLPRR